MVYKLQYALHAEVLTRTEMEMVQKITFIPLLLVSCRHSDLTNISLQLSYELIIL